jgi:hypothetical protein
MPYGYFMLVRFVMMVAFGILAYRYYMLHKHIAMERLLWKQCMNGFMSIKAVLISTSGNGARKRE